jgi:hypothetical protein
MPKTPPSKPTPPPPPVPPAPKPAPGPPPRKVKFIPEVAHHRHHKHKHHKHGDYGDEYSDGYGGVNFQLSHTQGYEGRWVGEEGGVVIAGKTEAEVHRRLDKLKPFMR